MRVLHSIDVRRLEDHLLDRIAARPRGGLTEPVLVLVPTSRLASYLERRILGRVPAALGVHILTHRGLAVRALEHALIPPPRVLAEGALLALVDGIAAGEDGLDAEAAHLREFPGARAALLRVLKDLRDAGISSREATAALGRERSPRVDLFLRAYEKLTAVLERLTKDSFTDAAGLVSVALPHVGPFLKGKGITHAFHHGAYELIGVHLELLEEVGRAAETTFLLPAEPEGPAFAYARRFATLLRARGASFEPAAAANKPTAGSRPEWIDRIRSLYSPEAGFSPRSPGSEPALELWSAQGGHAELRAAALRALELHHRDKIPLEEIAVVARSLEPYAPYIEAVFDGLGIPFSSSACAPLAREPAVSAFLVLVRVLARDFERAAVIDLLRRSWFRTEEDRGGADAWDRWSRAARIVSGLDEWQDLPDVAGRLQHGRGDGAQDPGEANERSERDRQSAERLVRILQGLEADRERWRRATTPAEHAELLRDLARRRIAGFSGGEAPPARAAAGAAGSDATARGFEAVLRLIDLVEIAGAAGAAALERKAGASLTIAGVDALAGSIAAGEQVGIHPRDQGGVRVLDLMQARGLVHRAVIWIGFHDGLFPRRAAEEPYLPDTVRARLADATGKPLAPKLAAADEEKLLLAMALASAGERLVISCQRADDDGQVRARSSALREVARAFLGRPDAKELLGEGDDQAGPGPFRPRYLSAHPGEEARGFADEGRGLLPPAQAATAAALGARSRRGSAAALALLERFGRGGGAVQAALRAVESIERFEPGEGAFDGKTGVKPSGTRRFSPTSIERLAQCPLRFFLRDVLGVHELDDAAEPGRIEKWALGQAAHQTLADLYLELHREGYLSGKAGAAARAEELLPGLWQKALRHEAGPSYTRLRGLFEALGARWLSALGEFVRRDIAEVLAAGSVTAIAVEKRVEADLEAAAGITIPLAGRVDRLIHFADVVWLDDYKTGKGMQNKIDVKNLLTGRDLQLPLYREIVAGTEGKPPAQVRARLLGVRPGLDADASVAQLELDAAARAGMLETIAVAWGLVREGSFPLHRDPEGHDSTRGYCSYCGYRRTCRRSHAPSVERLERDSGFEAYRKVWRKTRSAPTLAAVEQMEKARAEGKHGTRNDGPRAAGGEEGPG